MTASRMRVMLPWPPRELSPNWRGHWAKKAKAVKSYRSDGHMLAKAAKMRVDWDGPVHLWLTFMPPNNRARDDDNLISSFKAARDGIAQALGIDDARMVTHPFVSDKVARGGAVEVTITAGPEHG